MDFNHTMSTAPKQILILGGGFTGVYTARCLEEGDVEDDAELRRQLLTFVVGGDGFLGR